MKVISTRTFKHTLRDIHKNTENRKFCFVIGAGASRSSGIKTGKELAEKWFGEISERLEADELKDWMGTGKISNADLAASYGSIYRKRFENDKTSGYEFLVQAMKDVKPSYGHIVLAQILSRTTGHCVLTTNFDSLIESSVYQFTNKTPLVCGHESLSGYARPSQTHPLIVKIHRDLLLSPKNDPDEISKLDKGWKEPLDHIFSTHIPIVLGYGGNDGSLMSYFESMNKPTNFFWCGLDNKNVSERIRKLIQTHDGSFITIDGFDELMHELLLVFDEIGKIEKELNDIANERIRIVNKHLDKRTAPTAKGDEKVEFNVEAAQERKEMSALEYSNLADKEFDFEKRKQIYLEALGKYPETGWLWWAFTYFLHFIKKDYVNLAQYYEKALPLNKNEAGFLSNYALFVENIQRDYAKAEEYHLRALAANASNIYANRNYAAFMELRKKDYAKAEEYFLKALAIDPRDPFSNGDYARFLHVAKKDYAKAEEYYIKSITADPNDVNNTGNYALFLDQIRNNHTKAEELYVKVLAADPAHANNNVNYASFLHIVAKNYDKAEEHFKKALFVAPDDSMYNSMYAAFLKTIRKDNVNAGKHYQAALAEDKENVLLNGNYAQILLENGNEVEAEEFIQRAFTSKEEDSLLIELWFYRYAHYPAYLAQAEAKIEELLVKGIRSKDWDFDGNIKRAIAIGHPNVEKLKDFARRILAE